MIWKLPEKKVFVDGRMPSWKWNLNSSTGSQNAMVDYKNILTGEDGYRPSFEKYNVVMVLWPKRDVGDPFGFFEGKLNKAFPGLRESLGLEDNNRDFLKELNTDGWKKVYEDKVAVIYSAPEDFY